MKELLKSVSVARVRVWLCGALLFASAVATAQNGSSTVLRPVISERDIPVISLAPVASDGVVGEAFLRKPPGAGPFPTVVLVHGGAPRWPTPTLREFVTHIHASRFLEAGYVVVAITRRDLDLALPFESEQPAVLDGVAVLDLLKTLPYIDPDSIVVRGTSVGGYLTLEMAANRDVAAIAVEEPFAFPFVGFSAGGAEGQEPNTAKIAMVDEPILDIEGDQTPNINVFNRDVFLPALREAGKDLTLLEYPGQLHSFAFYDNLERTPHPEISLEAFREIDMFFRQHLRTQPQTLDPSLVTQEPVEYHLPTE